jgi:nitronate monooxygenase
VLGADLAYLRSRFIATNESLAGDDYRSAVVTASRGFEQDRLIRNRTAWSAGHSVSGVEGITSVAKLVGTIREQYDGARGTLQGWADGWAVATAQRPD